MVRTYIQVIFVVLPSSCKIVKNGPYNYYLCAWAKLYSPELHKCYFLYIHKQIPSKVPTFFFNGPKRPSDNCYITCSLREKFTLPGTIDYLFRIPQAFGISLIQTKYNQNTAMCTAVAQGRKACFFIVLVRAR